MRTGVRATPPTSLSVFVTLPSRSTRTWPVAPRTAAVTTTFVPAATFARETDALTFDAIRGTEAVAADVERTGDFPALLAVTRTASRWPMSAVVTRYVDPVAPRTAAPSRSHWRVKVTPLVFQTPSVAVRVRPTTAVPPTWGASTAARVSTSVSA